jgi:four helix bundle protein
MHDDRPSSFDGWITSIPATILQDPLWEYIAYQKALFLADLAWFDCGKMLKDERGRIIAGQLYGAACSISANVEEGYSKGFGLDYARFLTIALGSARETRGWYWRGRRFFVIQVLEHRFSVLNEIISLLKTTIPQQRQIGKSKSRIRNS